MPIWEAILLGVIQGATEFLPVSSTAHLVVARQALGHEHANDAFTTVVQLGTLVAVFAYFRADLWRMLRSLGDDIAGRKIASTPDSRVGWLIVAATVPVVVVGFRYQKLIKEKFYNLPTMGVVAIVFALLMLVADTLARRWRRPNSHADPAAMPAISTSQALQMGLWQALALMPGASRSGTTLTGGLFAGLDRANAARFSFLLSVPAVLGAGLKELYDEYKLLRHPELEARASLFASGDNLAALAVGLVVSAVVGYVAIAWLLQFLTRYSLRAFVGYRLLFGFALLGLWGAGALRPGAPQAAERQADRELAPPPRLALQRDTPAVGGDDAPNRR